MVYFARYNCQHLDNYRNCRVHKRPWLLRWFGRPACYMQEPRVEPQDGELSCPDELPWPSPKRPPAPPSPPLPPGRQS